MENPAIEFKQRIKNEKHHGREFGDDRCQGCTGDSHFRKSKFAEYQNIIEKNIDRGHHDSGISDHPGFGYPNI